MVRGRPAHGERKAQDCAERALLVWSPSQEEDVKLDKYIHIAIDKYGYNREQALAMLFWHKHDMDRGGTRRGGCRGQTNGYRVA